MNTQLEVKRDQCPHCGEVDRAGWSYSTDGLDVFECHTCGHRWVSPVAHRHDPCPVCAVFDSSHWVESGPGFDEWACRCGHTYLITVDEPSY